eukprot:1158213-Pelagomonas_calceolata.AAC.6
MRCDVPPPPTGNHCRCASFCAGGRQLDFAPSALEVLPAIVKAVNKRVPVFMTGPIKCYYKCGCIAYVRDLQVAQNRVTCVLVKPCIDAICFHAHRHRDTLLIILCLMGPLLSPEHRRAGSRSGLRTPAPSPVCMPPRTQKRCLVLATGYFDGGIRRGTDVLKALALGADCVLLGRPVLYGLALAGQEGVERVIGLLKSELELGMALAGVLALQGLSLWISNNG